MASKKVKNQLVLKVAMIGLLTALSTVFCYIKIPVVSSVTVTLVLPIVVIGAALYGPLVGAWLTVIPAISSFPEAALFMSYSPFGTSVTMILKGIAAGFAAGLVYKLLKVKHPRLAAYAASVIAPVMNTGVFLLGCYIFIWDELVAMANENGVGMGLLIFGLAGMNFIIELILNVVLCPAVIRIVKIASRKRLV